MIRPGREVWDRHPHVRSGSDLSLGERAADALKHWFGTWTALISIGLFIACWITLQGTSFRWDRYPFILLNLILSCVAAVQGVIIQISANRSDRQNAEVATGTHTNTQLLLQMQQQQTAILEEIRKGDV